MKINNFNLSENYHNQNIFDLIPASKIKDILLDLDVTSSINFSMINKKVNKLFDFKQKIFSGIKNLHRDLTTKRILNTPYILNSEEEQRKTKRIFKATTNQIKAKRLLSVDCNKSTEIFKIDLKMYLQTIKILNDKDLSQLKVKELL